MAAAAVSTVDEQMLVGPTDGRVTVEGPVGVVEKVHGRRTNGVISIVEHPIAVGVLVPPHVHTDFDEWSYVLQGRVGARIGDQEFTGEPGSYILKPRRIMHTFWNAGPDPARIIEIITPAGFEDFFADFGEMLRSGGFDPARMAELAAAHGTTYDMTWVPELESRYPIKLMS
jgi:quercetin dioxygenase-like cupin family protein